MHRSETIWKVISGISIWVTLGAIMTLVIFIYPLTLVNCPLQCTVKKSENEQNCYLSLSDHPSDNGELINCAYENNEMNCYAYTGIYNLTYLTSSRWEAQVTTALHNNWYEGGCVATIAIFTIYTVFGLIVLLVACLEFRRSSYQIISKEDRETI